MDLYSQWYLYFLGNSEAHLALHALHHLGKKTAPGCCRRQYVRAEDENGAEDVALLGWIDGSGMRKWFPWKMLGNYFPFGKPYFQLLCSFHWGPSSTERRKIGCLLGFACFVFFNGLYHDKSPSKPTIWDNVFHLFPASYANASNRA